MAFVRFLLLVSLLPFIGFAQPGRQDSLLMRLRQPLPDSEKLTVFMQLGKLNQNRSLPVAIGYFKNAIEVGERSHDAKKMGRAYSHMANAYSNHGVYDSALYFYSKGYDLAFDHRDTSGMIYSEMNAGTTYFVVNNYNKALEFFLRALLNAEKIHSVPDLARCLGNIGNVYKEQGKLKEALNYYNRSRSYALQLQSPVKLAVTYINTGNVYYDLARQTRQSNYLDSAYYLYTLGESTLLASPDSSILAMLYGNIANVFADKKQYTQAINLYVRALRIKKILEEESQIALLYENLASCYLEMNLPDQAKTYIDEGLRAAEESDSYEDMSRLYKDYSEFYRRKNDYRKAYENYVLYKQFADSVLNGENIERRKELEMNYTFDKEREQTELEQREKDIMRKEEKKRSQIYIAVTAGALLIVIIIALIILRSLRAMKRAHGIISKQKSEIEKQKELVEEKQKEILDSIRYAKRIQSSLLASETYIQRILGRLREN